MALVDSRACSHPGSIYSSHSAHWTSPSSRVSLYDLCASHPSSSTEALDHLSQSLASIDVQKLDTLQGLDASGHPSTGWSRAGDMDPTPPSASASKKSKDVDRRVAAMSSMSIRSQDKTTFQHWIRSLRRRAMHRSSVRSLAGSAATADNHHKEGLRALRRRKLSSDSSLAFITAVRSASVSLASASAVARSRRTQIRSHGRSRTDHSSRASFAGHRISEDNAAQEQLILPDIDAVQRAAQRRRILEELIATEESYISDLRFLMNVRSAIIRAGGLLIGRQVYITILAALPTLPATLRCSINHNLTEILQLHEEILGEMHRVVPLSEYTQPQLNGPALLPPVLSRRNSWGGRGPHRRWKSLDAVPEQVTGTHWMQSVPGILSDPQSAAEVSRVFGKKVEALDPNTWTLADKNIR